MSDDINGQSGGDAAVMEAAERINSLLSPTEPTVMRLQSLLVWEKPKQSAVLFLFVHVVFWYLAVTRQQIFFLCSLTAIVVYLVYTWKKKIWPEIRVPPPIPEDMDGWTPVHPRLLSIPEISQYLAQIWCGSVLYIQSTRKFRRNHPYQFGVLSSLCFGSLAVFGHFIPGIMLSYIFVISIMLWPSLVYHSILQKFYMKFEPLFMRLDYRLKIKSKFSFGVNRSRSTNENGGSGEQRMDTYTDGEEEDFSLCDDPATTAALARAITDSEDEGGTSALPSPYLSKNPSVDNSEDENPGENMEDLLTEGLAMPSIEDYLEHTDDELLDTTSLQPKYSKDTMTFVPSHFDEESGSDEDTLTRDLTFPDISKESSRDSQSAEDAVKASIAQAFVAQTFSSVMGSALQGLATLTQSTAPPTQESSSRVQVSYNTDTMDAVQMDLGTDPPSQRGSLQQRASEETSDIDIDEEFEFLDDYDVEESNEKEKS
ncbi:hypothetical protein ScPMuIL_016562 [Solemya velum]